MHLTRKVIWILLIGQMATISSASCQDRDNGDAFPRNMMIAYYDSTLKLFGYAAANGRRIPPRFQEAQPFSDGLAIVRSDGGLGVIDSKGRIVLEPRYSQISIAESGGLAAYLEATREMCVMQRRGRPQCVPYSEYWSIWREELLASVMPDKELILRVLELIADPKVRQREIVFLESTYVETRRVQARCIKRLLVR